MHKIGGEDIYNIDTYVQGCGNPNVKNKNDSLQHALT